MRFITFALSLLAAGTLAAQSAPSYRTTHTYTLGGDGRWDYITPDAPNHRVFIGRQNRVMVVDTENGKLLGEIAPVDGAHGVALVDHTGHGFATSGNDGSVLMFDLKTYKVLGRIPAAEDADAILYDRVSDRVFTFNGDAHSSTVVDPNEGRLVTNIPLGGKPESGASAGDGKVYVNLEEDDQVVEIDARSASVTRRWSTKPCGQPVAMAVDPAHHRLFSGCRSGVMAVSDYQAGKVVATEPIGSGVDGAGFDPATGDAFASCLDGTLTVIHQDAPDTYHVVQTLRTGEAARNMGLDPTTHRIYIVSADFGPAPAEATPDNPRKRPPVLPGTFKMMVIERVSS
jgi:DNA-binding beta-propeller fold protein YncE